MTSRLYNLKLFTVNEFYQMYDAGILKPNIRYELINGEVFIVKSVQNKEKGISSYLHEILIKSLKGQVIVFSKCPIRIDNINHLFSDITIAHFKKHRYKNVDTRPEDIHFLIEVSDSTLQKDRTLKRELYAKAGIPEYWIVNIPDEQIEVFKELKDGEYQETLILKKGETARFEGLVPIAIEIEIAVNDVFF